MNVQTVVHELAREGFEHAFGKPAVAATADDIWRAVRNTGTRLWLDTGDMEEAGELWNAEFEALTTNNTLLNKEIQKGIYDELMAQAAQRIRAASPDIAPQALLLEIAFVLNARHALNLVNRFDAFVSVELHTDLADNVERTVAYGRRFHAVCPERFIVKVPLSPAGLVGARRLSESRIPVNFTLGFSARQDVLSALVAQPAYVNVFMGRLNAFVADNRLGDGKNVGEKATLATQRAVRTLRDGGRGEARLIGASMREGAQVGTLAGLDVFTMPPKVAAQYHAAPLSGVTSRVDDDPPVTTSPGVALGDFSGQTLWDVPESLPPCAEEVGTLDPDRLRPAQIVDALRQAGHGDVFPAWSEADIHVASEDGKIPVYEHWKDRLASGDIGLDALMNLSAFRSFASDQAALDARIHSHIE